MEGDKCNDSLSECSGSRVSVLYGRRTGSQNETLSLIASENVATRGIIELNGSVLTYKVVEGDLDLQRFSYA